MIQPRASRAGTPSSSDPSLGSSDLPLHPNDRAALSRTCAPSIPSRTRSSGTRSQRANLHALKQHHRGKFRLHDEEIFELMRGQA